MALDPTALSALIVSNVSAKLNIVDATQLKSFADAVAAAVVTHVKTATVTVTGTATTSTGPAPVVGTGVVS